MNKKTLRQDNAGMSLLELVVAVSIFMVLALLLFRGFVSSSRLNKKSGIYLSATTTAQNIMEEIKAKTFAQTALAFNYPINPVTKENRFNFLQEAADISAPGDSGDTDNSDNTAGSSTSSVITKELLKSGDTYRKVRLYEEAGNDADKVTSSILSTDQGKTYTFLPRTKGANVSKYYFSMENIQNQNNTFDALIQFDGSKTSGYKKSASSKKTGKNDYLMPNISKLDTEKNAFLIMDQDWDQNAMNTMIKEQLTAAQAKYRNDGSPSGVAEPKELDYDEVYANTKRILEIKVTKEAGVVTAKARYTLWTYNYQNPDNPYETMSLCPCGGKNLGKSQSDTDWKQGCFCTYVSAYTAFYSSEAGNDLEGLYVFYYPNYKSTSSVNPLDEIVVDNTDNLKFNLYVTKQIPMADSSTGSDAGSAESATDAAKVKVPPTSTQEANYRMSLTIEENPTARGNANWNTNLGLYRAQIQLRSNLNYDISNLTQSSRPKLQQMKLAYTEVTDTGLTKKASGNSAQTVLDFNSLDDKEAYDRIYTATVSIYKAGAAERNFPDEDRILTLDGSKEN